MITVSYLQQHILESINLTALATFNSLNHMVSRAAEFCDSHYVLEKCESNPDIQLLNNELRNTDSRGYIF